MLKVDRMGAFLRKEGKSLKLPNIHGHSMCAQAAAAPADPAAKLAELLGPSTMPHSVAPGSSSFGDALPEQTAPLTTKPVADIDFDLDLSADDTAVLSPATQSPSQLKNVAAISFERMLERMNRDLTPA
jgi:hypothetical protein